MAATKKKAGSNGTVNRLPKSAHLVIPEPNLQVAEFTIEGTAPYVQHKFSEKSKQQMMDKQKAGSTANKGKKREPKDFQKAFEQAQYRSKEGWNGVPAGAFRSAMVDACRLVGFQMTKAKLAVFVLADGVDATEGTPLVKITKGTPKKIENVLRNETGVADVRARPMWDAGWRIVLRIEFDADMFTLDDVANLLHRVGKQVGIGEGRHNSRKCTGCGWGTFQIMDK